jgi:hypothetical protein
VAILLQPLDFHSASNLTKSTGTRGGFILAPYSLSINNIMYNYNKFVTREEKDETMRELARVIREKIEELDVTEEHSIAIASVLLKFSIGVYRGVIPKEEILHTLQYVAAHMEEITPMYPVDRTLN